MSAFDNVDIELLRRYSEPGPRYTSYPTAPVFTEAFGPDDFEAEIRASNESPERPLSLYFHLPFCDTLCYFCGCTMIATRRPEKKARYLEVLDREIERVAAMIHPEREVVQLHWGGGTPTDYAPDQIRWLAGRIRERFRFASDAECSCEIDPRGLTREHMEALRDGGFNRVSMGVQDFDPRVQEAVNRVQPEEVTRRVIQWSRELGFHSINLDFIYGLPHQTPASFVGTLDKIVELRPERIAIFNFAYVPWLKKHHKQLIDPETLPSAEERLEILKMTIEHLCGAGYVYIGMDHFALPDDDLAEAFRTRTLHRNFQGYSTHAECDLYGFGMSAISQLDGAYAQNHKELSAYYEAIESGSLATHCGWRLDDDDRLRRDVIMRIMCDSALDIPDIEARHGIEFRTYFADAIERMQRFVDDGLVTWRDDGFDVSEAGRLVIRNIAMCFDRHLERLRGDRPLFSKTV